MIVVGILVILKDNVKYKEFLFTKKKIFYYVNEKNYHSYT